ncbi:hypothetical protein IC619_016380 [Hazenella sp. IB182353]|nr:hypothetical protein [Polycladospora coralii]
MFLSVGVGVGAHEATCAWEVVPEAEVIGFSVGIPAFSAIAVRVVHRFGGITVYSGEQGFVVFTVWGVTIGG